MTGEGNASPVFLVNGACKFSGPDTFFQIKGGITVKYILGTLVLIVGMFGAAFGECSSADKAALEAFDRTWGKAGEMGDKAALMNIFADDFVGLPGMVSKTASIEGTMKAFEADKKNPNPDKVTHDHYYITCTPNSATITHRNVVWTADGAGGKPETFYTRSVHFLEKRGGKWQVVSNAGGGSMDDDAVLWYLEQDWNNALMTRDKAWFDKNYASDFSGVSGLTGKLSNKTQEISDIVGDTGLELAETYDMNVRVDGNRAIVTGVFRTKGKDDKGVAYDRRMRFTDTWIRRDGRWQAWASQGTIMK